MSDGYYVRLSVNPTSEIQVRQYLREKGFEEGYPLKISNDTITRLANAIQTQLSTCVSVKENKDIFVLPSDEQKIQDSQIKSIVQSMLKNKGLDFIVFRDPISERSFCP